MSEKVLYTGKTHTTGGKEGFTRSSDGELDLKLPEPHPTAEKLFAAAWSACYIGAIELAAARKKIKLPAHPAVDAEIDMMMADNAFFLRHASASASRALTQTSSASWPRQPTPSARILRRHMGISR